MAALALCTSLADLRVRMGRIVVGYDSSGTPITAEDLGVAGSMTVILKEAIKPNLMQTLEGTPALVHCGPFGNIATGNSSIIADQIGIHTGDFLLTEAGFGADMGAERFFNIKCRYSGIAPDAAVLVATVRGLKAHSGNHKIVAGRPLPEALLAENPDEVHQGGDNLRKQLENMKVHGVSPVVAINVFPGDHDIDIQAIKEIAEEFNARSAITTHFADGGSGAAGNLPVCIAKTHLSISSNAALKGAPTGWTLPVREVRASIGAGFVYPICGDMRTMPGLGSKPGAMGIDIDENGEIVGLS